MKTLVKAGATRMKPDELVSKTDYVVGKMTGNLAFANPSPTLAAMTDASTALSDANKAANSRASEAIATRNTAARTLRAMLSDLARYVNSVAEGDSAIALSSGFDAVTPPAPIVLVAPADLRARMSAYAGAIDLSWAGVRGAHMYKVQMSSTPDAPASWQTVGTATRRRFTKTDLPANVLYSFRVIALGALGEGPDSEIASAKAH
ncbi:MAG: fibronectin type III domain-containing protein [Flavobacteriales bacterium]|nr:MAG: fibronectin type III domain-containing protein [Flavobacteriales bacterium]